MSVQMPRGGTLTGAIAERDVSEALATLAQAPLVRVNRSTDQIEPWLAESWTVSADQRVFTFKLRQGLLWSNGRAFTSQDVERAFAADTSSTALLGKPIVARAQGPLGVQVTMPATFTPALRLIAGVPSAPQPGEEGGPGAGMGPFILVGDEQSSSSLAGRTLTFRRNPRYWRAAADSSPLPYLDSVVLNVTPDERPDLKPLLDGNIDFLGSVRPEDHAALERADQLNKVHSFDLGPGLVADGLWMNAGVAGPKGAAGPKGPALRTWMKTDEFRIAVSTAINRRAFCDAVYLGACDPVWAPVTPGNPAWFNADLPATHFDPPIARGMLASLGLTDRNRDGILDDAQGRPVKITLVTERGSTRHGLGARFLHDELRNIGIDVEVVMLDRRALDERRSRGDYDAIFDRFVPRDTDPAMDLDFWTNWPSLDWGRQLAELMRTQSSTADRVQRVQLFADAGKLYAQHMPVIFLGAAYEYVATLPKVMGVKPARGRLAVLWSADGMAMGG